MSTSPQPYSGNAALLEEADTINSIYDPDTVSLASSTSTFTAAVLKFPLHPITFLVSFERDYPDSPPRIDGTQSTGDSGKGEGEAAVKLLREVVSQVWKAGQVCLFDLIEEADPLLGKYGHGETGDTHVPEDAKDGPGPIHKHHMSEQSDPIESRDELYSPPDWTLSESVSSKKSTFIARSAKVSSKQEATAFISHLIGTDKKVAAATHNITAYRIRNPDTGVVVQDCDDDGETAAGGRLLHLMQLMGVWNVVVVVTRWYGGVLLGADRFRIINAVARDALVMGGFVDEEKEGGKKKGKKQ